MVTRSTNSNDIVYTCYVSTIYKNLEERNAEGGVDVSGKNTFVGTRYISR